MLTRWTCGGMDQLYGNGPKLGDSTLNAFYDFHVAFYVASDLIDSGEFQFVRQWNLCSSETWQRNDSALCFMYG